MHATERHTPTPRGKMSRRNETGPRRTQASHASNVRTHHANLLHRGVPSPYASGAGDVHSLSLAVSAALAGKEKRVRCMGDGGRRACLRAYARVRAESMCPGRVWLPTPFAPFRASPLSCSPFFLRSSSSPFFLRSSSSQFFLRSSCSVPCCKQTHAAHSDTGPSTYTRPTAPRQRHNKRDDNVPQKRRRRCVQSHARYI